MAIDYDRIKAAAAGQILQIAESCTTEGRLEGREFVMLNPNRKDDKLGSFKINVDTGAWADFAANQSGGDLISFLHYIKGFKNQAEAAKHLAEITGTMDAIPDKAPAKSQAKFKVVRPVPADAPPPYEKHYKLGFPSMRWEYKEKDGQTIGFIYRFEGDEGKTILPLAFCESEDGKKAWRWKGFDKPRPMYGMEKLKDFKGAQVIIVEGEKAAEAGQRLFDKAALVMTWHGGTKNIQTTDWKPIKGRKVVIWPDNDKVGIEAADKIAARLEKIADGIKVVNPPENKAKGWDIADGVKEGMSLGDAITYLKSNLRDPLPPVPDTPPASEKKKEVKKAKTFDADVYPFRCLGHHNGEFFYLPHGAQQILSFTGSKHDENNLTAYLAPMDFWQEHWTEIKSRPVKDADGKATEEWENYRTKIDWKAIKRFLIWDCQIPIGAYNGDKMLRGPGVWKDKARHIIHLGDRLYQDGQPVDNMAKIDSRYIYELKPTRELLRYDPLKPGSTAQLMELLKRFSWMRNASARLIGGWIVAGLMGGALTWRPHVWLNGPQSCGKSSVLKDVVKRIIGDCMAFFIEGATTEAGLRQEANHCSFPILFDEAESADRKGQMRMEQIIELMRASASPSGGKLLKGTPNGHALTFDVQSCFCLASISNNTRLAADHARIVNLEMTDLSGSTEKWEVFQRDIFDLLTPEWCGSFRAMVFHNLDLITKNIKVFIKAVRDEMDSQRYGDVYGVLLGASWIIDHPGNEPVTEKEAADLVNNMDWSEEKAQKQAKDELRCMKNILEQIIQIKGFHEQDQTMWELLKIAKAGDPVIDEDSWDQPPVQNGLKAVDANKLSQRRGVMYKWANGRDWVVIANDNAHLSRWLKDTEFGQNWAKWLKRIREVIYGIRMEAIAEGPRKWAGNSCRSTMIPWEIAEMVMNVE